MANKEESVPCIKCDATFPSNKEAHKHFRTEHSASDRMKHCPVCRKYFAYPKYIRGHVETMHPEYEYLKGNKVRLRDDNTEQGANNAAQGDDLNPEQHAGNGDAGQPGNNVPNAPPEHGQNQELHVMSDHDQDAKSDTTEDDRADEAPEAPVAAAADDDVVVIQDEPEENGKAPKAERCESPAIDMANMSREAIVFYHYARIAYHKRVLDQIFEGQDPKME